VPPKLPDGLPPDVLLLILQVALMVIVFLVRHSVQDLHRRLRDAEVVRQDVRERLAAVLEAQRHNDSCVDRLKDRVEHLADLWVTKA
jgi:hypothetical protein